VAGTNIYVMTERVYRTLIQKGMDLRCKCSFDCNRIITVHDSVVSKPSKKGRKYYLLEHYEKMMIDIPNGNGDDYEWETNHEEETFFAEVKEEKF